MNEETKTETPNESEEQLPPYVIEGARSSRSKCKTCRRAINKDVLRLGVLVDGRFGVGYMWHHLKCAAKRKFDNVAEAYELKAWNEAKVVPAKVPDLESLRKLVEVAERKRAERKQIPYVELDPSGRAKCKRCNETIEKGGLRVILGRDVEFGNQVRVGPINVHPRCVAEEIDQPDCSTESEGFGEALRANSSIDGDQIDRALEEIGEIE